MRVNFKLRSTAALIVCIFPLMAIADEQMVPLAQSGEWVAIAHKLSITARPDVCIAFNPIAGIALRGDGDTVEFRVIDKKWSLPASVTGWS